MKQFLDAIQEMKWDLYKCVNNQIHQPQSINDHQRQTVDEEKQQQNPNQ